MYDGLFYPDGQTGHRRSYQCYGLAMSTPPNGMSVFCAALALYEAVDEMDIGFCVGLGFNERLKRLIANEVEEVEAEFAQRDLRHQHFVGPFAYQTERRSRGKIRLKWA